MDYNTVRNRMVIPEYGRNIQKMVEYALTVEDREKRTKIAYLISNVMSQLAPGYKDTVEFRHKIWDHLHIMSDFKLDVDSPYPPPSQEVLHLGPKQLRYQQTNIKYRHYGKNIEMIIEKAATYEDGPEKEALIRTIANHMKKSYLNWNRNSVDDDVILKNLAELSTNRLQLSEDHKLSHTNEILARNKKKKFIKPGTNPYGNPNGNSGGSYNKLRKKMG